MIVKTEMTALSAKEISEWCYTGDYEEFNLPNWNVMVENNHALCNEEKRKKNYNAYKDNAGECIGFTRVDELDSEVIIGIGICPNVCGQGIGQEILKMTIFECDYKYPEKSIVLQVNSWNQRAINCYRSAGFTILRTYIYDNEEFCEMEYIK